MNDRGVWIAVCATLVWLAGCVSARPDTGAERAVRAFFIALADQDWATAADLADYETAAEVVRMARVSAYAENAAADTPDGVVVFGFYGAVPVISRIGSISELDTFRQIEVLDIRHVSADSAEVEVRFPDGIATETIPVIRLAGQWRVDVARLYRTDLDDVFCSPETCPEDYVLPDDEEIKPVPDATSPHRKGPLKPRRDR